MWCVFRWQRHSGARNRAGRCGTAGVTSLGTARDGPSHSQGMAGINVQEETATPPCLASQVAKPDKGSLAPFLRQKAGRGFMQPDLSHWLCWKVSFSSPTSLAGDSGLLR